MRKVSSIVVLLTAAAAVQLSAHVTVSPLQSKAGAVQKYELRIHNESKSAATSIDLDVPDGVTVTEVARPASGSFATKTTGDRITVITWQVDVQPGKYVALPFTAKNPSGATELRWSMHEHLADGSTIDWSDKPGSKEKGSVTKLGEAAASARTWMGTVSDKMCGADHKKMGGKLSDRDCTIACAKGGASYVLVAEGTVYQLANHEADLRAHAGHKVEVAGDLTGDTIRVSKIDMLQAP